MKRIRLFFSSLLRSFNILNRQSVVISPIYRATALIRVDETNVSPQEAIVLRDFANDLIESGLGDHALMYGIMPFATPTKEVMLPSGEKRIEDVKEGPRLTSNEKFNFVKLNANI